jgi:hypothetical protein
LGSAFAALTRRRKDRSVEIPQPKSGSFAAALHIDLRGSRRWSAFHLLADGHPSFVRASRRPSLHRKEKSKRTSLKASHYTETREGNLKPPLQRQEAEVLRPYLEGILVFSFVQKHLEELPCVVLHFSCSGF